MSRQIGTLNRYISYPSILNRQSSRTSLSDLTSSPLPSFSSNSPGMDSNDSTQTVFNTISNFNNSGVETPDKFLLSEPSLTNFSQPPYRPIASQLPNKSSLSPSLYTHATLSFPQCQVHIAYDR